jgi:hypothetical protein
MIVNTKERDLARNVVGMALVNTNKEKMDKYKEEKRKALEMAELRDEVRELKSLILQIVKNNG